MIPIKIETLLEGRKVEQSRIEYKEGFNPSDIVHTICAYANDIAGVDGGYLVIGVKAESGVPLLPPVGVQREQLDDIQLKIFEYCNKIEPRYIPKIDVVEYKGVYLVYLKCAAGDAGPYQAPVDVYFKKEPGKTQNRTMKYWIRPASLTTEAKQSELAELFEKFASLPFVDRINSRASMEHIRRGYLEDFIRESNSTLIEELNVRSLEDLLVSEEVAEERDEGIAIRNIGLLMFGERPDKLIPGTKIELVRFHDKEAEASDFTEKTFYGPIWKQIKDALGYMKTNVLEEKVVKVDGKAEADRFFNYPYNALEEALVNAVLHKSYKEDVPVEIRIYVDQIQIINFPGPEHYIDMEKFAAGKVRARRYRNPKIGEFFKEIGLSEKKSTGISKILRELERNGSPLPEFETDADRTYMITTIRIHERFEQVNENFGQKNDRSLTEVLTILPGKQGAERRRIDMGIYLNPQNKRFQESIRSEIYVDKTGLIRQTNRYIHTEQKFICVSRPRRFGKSMALEMLAAYYSRGCDSAELFQGLAIAQDGAYREHLNRYDVIFLNIQQFLIEAPGGKVTEYLEQEVLRELRREYGEYLDRQGIGLAAALRDVYAETDRTFIFLIDEWDCVMRERQESEEMQRQYLDFLRNLLKDQPYVALAYMTGILPVKKYGQHSALNMFWEYSMTDQKDFEEYTGFTEDDVKGLCGRFGMDFEETGSWYDGYVFRKFKHIYNPRSVVEAMSCGRLSNYWTSTEVYDALKVYMDMDFDGLRSDIVQMLGGGRVRVNTRSFRNDMRNLEVKDDVLTLLVHLGYLAYDAERREAFIPNREIIEEFETAMSTRGWSEVMRVLKASEKLLEDTLRQDGESVAQALDRAHSEVASILTYNDENALGCAIGLAYYSARKDYLLIRELPAGKGFADVAFLPLPHTNRPAFIVELKYDRSAQSAIRQIKDRCYVQAFEHYTGEILLVGISYDRDRKDKPHCCVIEKWEKGYTADRQNLQ